jgi:uncharacterized protein YecA (UPF0149 family)
MNDLNKKELNYLLNERRFDTIEQVSVSVFEFMEKLVKSELKAFADSLIEKAKEKNDEWFYMRNLQFLEGKITQEQLSSYKVAKEDWLNDLKQTVNDLLVKDKTNERNRI